MRYGWFNAWVPYLWGSCVGVVDTKGYHLSLLDRIPEVALSSVPRWMSNHWCDKL